MSTRESASQNPKRGRDRHGPATSRAYGVDVPAALHEAIETERGNLARADSLLGCLVIAMECEPDSVTAPYYPDVAQMARDLVRQSMNGLDSLTLEKLLSRNKVKEEIRLLLASA
jgi:hypothetical protein